MLVRSGRAQLVAGAVAAYIGAALAVATVRLLYPRAGS